MWHASVVGENYMPASNPWLYGCSFPDRRRLSFLDGIEERVALRCIFVQAPGTDGLETSRFDHGILDQSTSLNAFEVRFNDKHGAR